MSIQVGDKFIERNYGASQDDRHATPSGQPVLMTALRSYSYTVIKVESNYAHLHDGHLTTKKIAFTSLQTGSHDSFERSVECRVLRGPWEKVGPKTAARDAKWAEAKRTKEDFWKLQHELARESMAS